MNKDHGYKLFIGALFLSGKPLDMPTLKKFLHIDDLEATLIAYMEMFNSQDNGIRIRMVSGGFQMVTEAELSATLEAYFGEKTEQLSRGGLETLSVIAYKQPATKAEIEQIRGVDCSGSMRSLLDKGLIAAAGRKNVAGRPLLYITTKYFLEFFGINELSELPSFREWQELQSSK
jgi:segregation and condensation protein B